jgi:abhydrolase domain-containing protein 17
MVKLIVLILGSYVFLTLFAYFLSDHLIFLPPQAGYKNSEQIIRLQINKNISIAAWYLPNPEAKYTILISHGNAEDLGYMRNFLQEFSRRGFAVFAYDYEGYGLSQGFPSEKHAYRDVDVAYSYLVNQLKIPPEKIIGFGNSVGGGVTIDLAARKPLKAVIVQGTFLSAYRVITQAPVLLFDKFINSKKIAKLTMPILFIHGTKDEVIPFWQGEKLYQAASSKKEHLWIENAGHNNIISTGKEKYCQGIVDFVKGLD